MIDCSAGCGAAASGDVLSAFGYDLDDLPSEAVCYVDKVKGMVGEVKEAYESLSARGRVVFKEGLAKTAHRDITPPVEQSTDYEQPPTS